MKLTWDERGWDDYCRWQDVDRKTLKRINSLLKNICRTPYHSGEI